jgi:hypothetical protein
MEWTYYDSLSPPATQDTPRLNPTVQSRTDATNPELELYNNMVRQKSQGAGGETAIEPVKQNPVSTSPPVKAADISDPNNVSDFIYIVIALIFVEVILIFLVRFYPEIFGRSLNRWYDLFGLNAVLADILIIVLGFVIARYVYTYLIAPKFLNGEWSPVVFTGTVVGIQMIHDVLFYLCVILPLPRGQNLMMDIFKDYSASAGGKAILGDSILVIASSLVAIVLKGLAADKVAAFGFLAAYALPYILYTRNQFTILR